MIAAKGVLTSEGGATSHAAVVARQFGIPCVVGASAIKINLDKREFTVGDKGSYVYIVFGAPVAHRDDAMHTKSILSGQRRDGLGEGRRALEKPGPGDEVGFDFHGLLGGNP